MVNAVGAAYKYESVDIVWLKSGGVGVEKILSALLKV